MSYRSCSEYINFLPENIKNIWQTLSDYELDEEQEYEDDCLPELDRFQIIQEKSFNTNDNILSFGDFYFCLYESDFNIDSFEDSVKIALRDLYENRILAVPNSDDHYIIDTTQYKDPLHFYNLFFIRNIYFWNLIKKGIKDVFCMICSRNEKHFIFRVKDRLYIIIYDTS